MEYLSLASLSMAAILANASLSNDIADEGVQVYELPEIAGVWILDATKEDTPQQIVESASTCQERYNFDRDNTVITISGKEWTYSRYYYQAQNSGLPVLMIQTLYDNNEMDCWGKQIDQKGDGFLVYVDYRPDTDQMRWCEDATGEQCLLQFHRLLP